MSKKIPKSENRTLEQLREHYEIEKELANRLRNANKEERKYLYSSVYDELYKRVHHHPQVARKKGTQSKYVKIYRQMRFLKRFLTRETSFLEVGSGDCSLSLKVSKYVRKVSAIDVSEEITKDEIFPQNFELVISDGSSIPIPDSSIDIAYSWHLMEHLHPDDAFDQLQNIYKALKHEGKYICITPNRLSGPWDISMYFDKVATGFHLKEYTFNELRKLFTKVGFSKISVYIGGKGIYMKFPLYLIILCEKFLNILPFSLRKIIANTLPFKALLGVTIVGIK